MCALDEADNRLCKLWFVQPGTCFFPSSCAVHGAKKVQVNLAQSDKSNAPQHAPVQDKLLQQTTRISKI